MAQRSGYQAVDFGKDQKKQPAQQESGGGLDMGALMKMFSSFGGQQDQPAAEKPEEEAPPSYAMADTKQEEADSLALKESNSRRESTGNQTVSKNEFSGEVAGVKEEGFKPNAMTREGSVVSSSPGAAGATQFDLTEQPPAEETGPSAAPEPTRAGAVAAPEIEQPVAAPKADTPPDEKEKVPQSNYDKLLLTLTGLGATLGGGLLSRATGGSFAEGALAGGAAGFGEVSKYAAGEDKRAYDLKLAQAKGAGGGRYKPEKYRYQLPGSNQSYAGQYVPGNPEGQRYTDMYGNPLGPHIPYDQPRVVVGAGGEAYAAYPGSGTMAPFEAQGQQPQQAPQAAPVSRADRGRKHGLSPNATDATYEGAKIGEAELNELDQLQGTKTPQASKRYRDMQKTYNDALKEQEKRDFDLRQRNEQRGYTEGVEKDKRAHEEIVNKRELDERTIQPRAQKLSQSMGYYVQFVPSLRGIKTLLAKGQYEDARIEAESLAKVLNSMATGQSDVVGAEEIGRLLPETKFKAANYFGPGKAFGTDLEGFTKRMDRMLKSVAKFQRAEAETIAPYMGGSFPGRYHSYSNKEDVDDLTSPGDRFMIGGQLFERTKPDASGNYLKKVQ